MDFSKELEIYIANHTKPESETLVKLNRETNIKILNPRMLSGHIQGQFLTLLCKMIRPQLGLEIGTFTGYSAICIAQGMSEGSLLHTIEIDDELREMALNYFEKTGVKSKIVYHTGNAIELIPRLNLEFDFIYIDGEKREYPEYYKATMNVLKPGGFMIADNVLWNGKVVDPSYSKDPSTKAIQTFNETVQNDNSVENVLLPLKDGIMIIRKKEIA